MTIEFDSLAGLAMHLTREVLPGLSEGVHQGLEQAAILIEIAAKAELGEFQPAAGAFPAWAPLAEATKADRIAQGFTPDDPLLRSGELRDSIVHEVGDWEATIGSTDPVMEFHEFGTSKMPQRPVFGPAVLNNADHVEHLIGNAVVSVIVGGEKLKSDDYTLKGSAD